MENYSITIVSKRRKREQAKLINDGYLLIDVTSKSDDATFQKFSPFYPHKDVPVVGLSITSESVEGVWQGLKVFEKEGVDLSKFRIKNMKNIKRPVNEKRGRIVGHLLNGNTLDYKTARKKIYIPTYQWLLRNKLCKELQLLQDLVKEHGKIAFIDYDTNTDIENLKKPLSHASIIIQELNILLK